MEEVVSEWNSLYKASQTREGARDEILKEISIRQKNLWVSFGSGSLPSE